MGRCMDPAREGGFSIVEAVIAAGLMLLVTASVFAMMHPAQGSFAAQPEVADMQQRLRVGVDSLSRSLLMAGAGPYSGTRMGSLGHFFAPLLPFRHGATGSDPPGTFRTDRITVMYVPPTTGQTTLAQALGPGETTLIVATESDCAAGVSLCGFSPGETVLVFDNTGNFDMFTVSSVDDLAARIAIASRPPGSVTTTYPAGSRVVDARSDVYALKTDVVNGLFQLMHYDGSSSADMPVLDHVVGLKFEYFGEPNPPVVINPGAADLTATYGPAPTAGVANCIFAADAPAPSPKLAVLGNGGATLVPLTAAELTDGPWCPDDANANRWDADLLRIRKVAVTLRVESALAQLRGPASVLFTNGGSSPGGNQWLPDQEIRFQIAPRDLNLGR